jgi:hypothetical protein
MITSDTPNTSLRQAMYGFRKAMRLDTTAVLHTNHHPNSSSEQMPCREEGEMGSQVIQNPLPAMTTDTSLSLKDTSDIQRESPSRYTHERIQSCFRKTLNGQKSDPGLNTEGVHSIDTLKMDEPTMLRTNKLQYPSEPRNDTILLDKTDTEVREFLICLITQNKEQQVQIKAMNLMLKIVQTSIVSKLHVTETELLPLSKSKGKDSNHEETRKVVKSFGPRAYLNKEASVCTKLPTTSLDDSEVNSHDSYNCSSLFYDDGGFNIPLSQILSQHDWGSSRVIVHGSTLQNYVYPNLRSPSIDASQETDTSKINLDRSTENPRANYARACLATPREKHIDTSVSADESELFGAPRDIDASQRIKASTESPIPTEAMRICEIQGRRVT